jgi:hypothetical protein
MLSFAYYLLIFLALTMAMIGLIAIPKERSENQAIDLSSSLRALYLTLLAVFFLMLAISFILLEFRNTVLQG